MLTALCVYVCVFMNVCVCVCVHVVLCAGAVSVPTVRRASPHFLPALKAVSPSSAIPGLSPGFLTVRPPLFSPYLSCSCCVYRLIDLVIKASSLRAEDLGFSSSLSRGGFSGSSHTSEFKNWHSSGYPARCLAL